MAGVFFDSVDHYATANIQEKWTQVHSAGPIVAAVGRRSTNGLRFRNYSGGVGSVSGDAVRVTPFPVPSGDTCIVGYAFNHVSPFADTQNGTVEDSGITVVSTMLAIRQGATTQVWFVIMGDGTISARRGTTVLGTSTFALTQNVYQYIEFKVKISATVGTIEVRVNTVPILTLTGQNTLTTASATWNEIKIGQFAFTAPNVYVDDIYVLDGSGSFNNDFLGDVRIDAVFPNADGNSSQFTRSTGTDQYATVDETSPNGDTDYNETATVGNRDTLNYPNAPVAGANILAIQGDVYGRKTDAGGAGVKLITRIAGTDYQGTEVGIGTSYNYQRQVWDVKPSDSTAWTDTDFNAAEFGYIKST